MMLLMLQSSEKLPDRPRMTGHLSSYETDLRVLCVTDICLYVMSCRCDVGADSCLVQAHLLIYFIDTDFTFSLNYITGMTRCACR